MMTRQSLLYLTLLAIVLMTSGCGAVAGNVIAAVTPLPATSSAPTATPQLLLTATATAAQSEASAVTPAPTPTPLDLNLPAGSALSVARATDVATRPTPRTPVTFTEFPVKLTFDEFYDGYNVRTGLILSDKLVSLDGQPVVIEGYMAPPLKAELDWFVLTRIQLAYCPFCSTAADWPDDIALVYLDDSTIRPTERPMRLYGTLEVGPSIDPETGMLSLVRIYADKLELL
jgi:hypothetical protein